MPGRRGHAGHDASGAPAAALMAERPPPSSVRVDKWLWAVRLYPTRTAATAACGAGRVEIDDSPAKASRPVAVGDVVKLRGHDRVSVCRVERLIEKRVGAPIAVTCYVDLSPPAAAGPGDDAPWWDRLEPVGRRERGAGRPTKRDRRRIERFRGSPGA